MLRVPLSRILLLPHKRVLSSQSRLLPLIFNATQRQLNLSQEMSQSQENLAVLVVEFPIVTDPSGPDCLSTDLGWELEAPPGCTYLGATPFSPALIPVYRWTHLSADRCDVSYSSHWLLVTVAARRCELVKGSPLLGTQCPE
ncbi:hypothetical protein RRG08_020680 [Elysia crispata]|uniref:Uncharacterized protein n=1 Tax=Elysia crispata TaxID=231223 RepID=A0AAE1D9S8_9GAST|nr:hypothetical protein RRG08_020680 [Elysia crispata]